MQESFEKLNLSHHRGNAQLQIAAHTLAEQASVFLDVAEQMETVRIPMHLHINITNSPHVLLAHTTSTLRDSPTGSALPVNPQWLAVKATLSKEQLDCVREVQYADNAYCWGQCQACMRFVHGVEHYGAKHAKRMWNYDPSCSTNDIVPPPSAPHSSPSNSITTQAGTSAVVRTEDKPSMQRADAKFKLQMEHARQQFAQADNAEQLNSQIAHLRRELQAQGATTEEADVALFQAMNQQPRSAQLLLKTAQNDWLPTIPWSERWKWLADHKADGEQDAKHEAGAMPQSPGPCQDGRAIPPAKVPGNDTQAKGPRICLGSSSPSEVHTVIPPAKKPGNDSQAKGPDTHRGRSPHRCRSRRASPSQSEPPSRRQDTRELWYHDIQDQKDFHVLRTIEIAPHAVRFSQFSAYYRFSDGRSFSDLYRAIKNGEQRVDDIPPIRVFQRSHNEETATTHDNRRLLVYQQLENDGYLQVIKCQLVSTPIPQWQYTTKDDGLSLVIVNYNDRESYLYSWYNQWFRDDRLPGRRSLVALARAASKPVTKAEINTDTKIKTEPGIKTEPEIKAEIQTKPEIKAEVVAETKPAPKSEPETESEPVGAIVQPVEPMAELVSEQTPVAQARGRVRRQDPSQSHGPTKRQRRKLSKYDAGKELILKRLEEGKAKWHEAEEIQHVDVLRSLLFLLAGS